MNREHLLPKSDRPWFHSPSAQPGTRPFAHSKRHLFSGGSPDFSSQEAPAPSVSLDLRRIDPSTNVRDCLLIVRGHFREALLHSVFDTGVASDRRRERADQPWLKLRVVVIQTPSSASWRDRCTTSQVVVHRRQSFAAPTPIRRKRGPKHVGASRGSSRRSKAWWPLQRAARPREGRSSGASTAPTRLRAPGRVRQRPRRSGRVREE